MPTENIFANIHALCNKLNSYETTLIHCMFGISRSATITIAYIMLTNKMYLDEATKLILHRPKRKMRQTFYKKIKNLSISLFGDVKAPLKGVILFDDYNLLRL